MMYSSENRVLRRLSVVDREIERKKYAPAA